MVSTPSMLDLMNAFEHVTLDEIDAEVRKSIARKKDVATADELVALRVMVAGSLIHERVRRLEARLKDRPISDFERLMMLKAKSEAWERVTLTLLRVPARSVAGAQYLMGLTAERTPDHG